MSNYRAVIHYKLKKGMEQEAIRFMEKELIQQAENMGCHHIEIVQNEQDPTSLMGIALWNDLEDARNFQSQWEGKEKEFMKFCTSGPRREFCKICCSYQEKRPEKKRKAA